MSTAHPELHTEQTFVDRAYSLLDRGLADKERNIEQYRPLTRDTQQAMQRALAVLRESRGEGQLVFGRIDRGGTTRYIGRRGVRDEDRNVVVVNWAAPAAQAYYEATPGHPGAVDLKRVLVEQDRVLERVVDEIVRSSASAASGTDVGAVSDALLQELDRSRDGAMREVVATIQAEQHRIIRAAADQLVVVQGGPGTGKTVVGLHRAAWLAYNQPELVRQGLLVVGPNRTYLSYVSGVLPSLEATEVTQLDIRSLYVGEARVAAVESRATARVKGSAAMAVLLTKALAARIGWDGGDLVLALGMSRVTVPATEVETIVEATRSRRLPYNEGREVLRSALSALVLRHASAQRPAGAPLLVTEATIRRLSTFVNALDRMWPSFTPEDFLRTLLGTQTWLVAAADGVLAADERASLFRVPRESLVEEPWTAEDLYCLDEVSHLLNGDTNTFGYVVVDEAQDLSPMQARAIARRCPTGAMTILGDLAQASGAWMRDSWVELTEHLGDATVVSEELTIGYRVPAEVLDAAARQLPLSSPGLTAPVSVRAGRGAPSFGIAEAGALLDVALRTGESFVAEGLTTALVVSDARYDKLVETAREQFVDAGDGRAGDLARPLTVLTASLAKGLEFDAVVLVEPDEIVGSGPDGRRLLYTAMTRCTQVLHVVHSGVLPTGLDDPSAGVATQGAVPVTTPATDDGLTAPTPRDALKVLVDQLSDDDVQLITDITRRLVNGAARE